MIRPGLLSPVGVADSPEGDGLYACPAGGLLFYEEK